MSFDLVPQKIGIAVGNSVVFFFIKIKGEPKKGNIILFAYVILVLGMRLSCILDLMISLCSLCQTLASKRSRNMSEVAFLGLPTMMN